MNELRGWVLHHLEGQEKNLKECQWNIERLRALLELCSDSNGELQGTEQQIRAAQAGIMQGNIHEQEDQT